MDFKELVTFYFERSNALQTYWSFYVTIILGLLAFFGAAKPSPHKRLLALVVSVAYIMFACVNLAAVEDVTNARLVAQNLISEIGYSEPGNKEVVAQIQTTIKPPKQWQVAAMHISGDLMLLAGIWILTLRKVPQDLDS